MSLLRNSTLNQLKRINSEIKKQGGITDRSNPAEKNMANNLFIHDPVDADKSGKRKIATYDQMYSTDIPDASTTVKMNNESMKVKKFSEMNEKADYKEDITPQEINKSINRINNWHSENSPKREFDVNLIGKFIDNGKVKGYIQRIDGTNVFVDSIVEPLGVVKLTIKDALKGFKPEKLDKVMKVADFSITGPNNISVGVKPSEGNSYSPKIEDKATKVKDQKISDKNNIVKFSK